MFAAFLLLAPQQVPGHDLSPGAELLFEGLTEQVQAAASQTAGLALSDSVVAVVAGFTGALLPDGTLAEDAAGARGFDRVTGAQVWERRSLFAADPTSAAEEFVGSVAPDTAGLYFAVQGSGGLAVFETHTGSRLWLDESITLGEIAFDQESQTLYHAFGAELTAREATTGAILWTSGPIELGVPPEALLTHVVGNAFAAYVVGRSGSLPFVRRVETGTGIWVAGASPQFSLARELVLSPSGSHLAVVTEGLGFPFDPAVASSVDVYDAQSLVRVAKLERPGLLSDPTFSADETRLFGAFGRELPGQSALLDPDVWCLAVPFDLWLWRTSFEPGFGAESISRVEVEVDGLGRVRVALGGTAPFDGLGGPSSLELWTLEPMFGDVVGSTAVTSDSLSGFNPLEAYRLEGDQGFLARSAKSSPIDEGGVGLLAFDPADSPTWTAVLDGAGAADQSVLDLAAREELSLALVLERLGGGVQVRSLDPLSGAERWRVALDGFATLTEVELGFDGDLVLSADGNTVAVLYQAIDSASPTGVSGVLEILETADGSLRSRAVLPQLHSGADGAQAMRSALTHDGTTGRWVVAGGLDEDRVLAFESDGAAVWDVLEFNPFAPNPASEQFADDGPAVVASAQTAGLALVAATHRDPGGFLGDLDPVLAAHRVSDGSLAWAQSLTADTGSDLFGEAELERAVALSVAPETSQAVLLVDTDGTATEPLAARAVACDLGTGAVLWEHAFPVVPDALGEPAAIAHVLEGQVAIVAGGPGSTAPPDRVFVHALGADGGALWSLGIDTVQPLEVTDLVPLKGGNEVAILAGAPRETALQSGSTTLTRVVVVNALDGTLLWEDVWGYTPELGFDDAIRLRLAAGADFGDRLLVAGDAVLASQPFEGDPSIAAYGVSSFTSDVGSLAWQSGGSQPQRLHPGTDLAGALYWVLGSVSGTAGIALGGDLVLPLTLDSWTSVTLSAPNAGPLVNTLGQLDAFGCGNAALDVPPTASPQLLGATVHHAFVVLDPVTLAIELASNPLPLVFLP
ncbi:MAG: PQQ-binding-like beta-propeller repeat protein [Planctomycetota bacterium]